MKVQGKWIARLTLLSLVFLGGIVVSSVNVSAQAKATKQKMTSSRKTKTVSLESARKTALRHSAGTVQREEMETQKGRSIYAFDIRNKKGATNEVWVDSRTGRMIRKSRKSEGTDSQEKVAYAKKKTKH